MDAISTNRAAPAAALALPRPNHRPALELAGNGHATQDTIAGRELVREAAMAAGLTTQLFCD